LLLSSELSTGVSIDASGGVIRYTQALFLLLEKHTMPIPEPWPLTESTASWVCPGPP